MRSVALFALVACSKSDPPPPPLPAPVVVAPSLCDSIDRAALAKALEVAAVTPGDAAPSPPGTLSCGWTQTGDDEDGVSFGFTLEDTSELEGRDPRDRFTWKPYPTLGPKAAIGTVIGGLHVQTIANGVRLHAEIDHPAANPLTIEPMLVAATKLVIAKLPTNPRELVR